MSASAVVFALALLAPSSLAFGAASATRTQVTPGSGKTTTTFLVRFQAPYRTGSFGGIRRDYEVSVSGPREKACISMISMTLSPTQRGDHVSVPLDPKRHGGVWCGGKFRGDITELQMIICNPDMVCPQIVIAPRTIARFSFRVAKPRH
jgi:hypothetical protein